MEQKSEKQARIKRAANGTRTQKMVSFRLDAELLTPLAAVANKGRLINKLLRDYFARAASGATWEDPDEQPERLEDNYI